MSVSVKKKYKRIREIKLIKKNFKMELIQKKKKNKIKSATGLFFRKVCYRSFLIFLMKKVCYRSIRIKLRVFLSLFFFVEKSRVFLKNKK